MTPIRPQQMIAPSTESPTRRLKIVMIGSWPPQRAISSYCMELVKGILPEADVEFIGFKSMYPRWLYPGGDLADDTSFPTLDAPGLLARRALTWYNPISWLLVGLRVKGDVVHIQHWTLPLSPIFLVIAALLRCRRQRLALTIHNVASHEGSKAYLLATRVLAAMAGVCIFHSEQNCREASSLLRLDGSRIRKIKHGMFTFLNSGKGDRASARRSLNLPADAAVVLCFGAIREYKGVDVLIRAFARVLHEQPKAKLLIMGKLWVDWSPYAEQIERLGLQEAVTVRHGYVPTGEMASPFLASDVVVLPYRHFGGQSGVGAASLAFAKPLIVTRTGGLPELVADPRCVVPPGDHEELADRLILMLGDQRFRQKQEALARRTARSFSWEVIGAKTVEIYKEQCQR